MKVYVARVVTDSADTYVWVYSYKPTHDEVVKRVHEMEGEYEALEWYRDTTAVYIEKTEVIMAHG